MPKPKRRLSDLRIHEIAFCRGGMHPMAKILLYKSADGADAALDVLAALEDGRILFEKFRGSPRSRYGTHASKGFKGNYGQAWRIHFSRIGGGALTGQAGGPIRGTVRRTEMIAAAMKPPCNLPSTDSVGPRAGGPSPLKGDFPEKPSDYGLSSWDSPENAEDARLTCADLAVIKRAALAEIKWRAAEREKREAGVRKGHDALELETLVDAIDEILGEPLEDFEEPILKAFDEYGAAVSRDLPDLFGVDAAEQLNSRAAEGRPSHDDVSAIVATELELAGTVPDKPGGGGAMQFLKSLSKRGKAALGYVLGEKDPAEFFKGTSEDVGKLIAGLLEKAAESGERIEKLEVDLEKASKPKADPNSLESILKAVGDPGVRAYIETQAAAVKSLGGKVAELTKSNRRKELEAIVKSCEHLPSEGLVDVLEKADLAGILEPIEKILRSANEQAKLGKAFEELGVETLVGDAAVTDPAQAYEALVAKGAEIRKVETKLTAEQAFEKACELNPDLYEASQRVPSH